MAIITVTKENFDAIKAETKTVLLDFYADWCGPCRMVGPIVHEIAEERDDIVVGKINVDEQPELAATFEISVIPTLVAMKDGGVLGKSTGVISEAKILELLRV